ncbi:MAG: hypothetical protein D6694_07135 [Gammaproteobacteria bacterium]|nr:MAG: hypothetical protein D6694_07135 [Gammaproteobacteria bacterium]
MLIYFCVFLEIIHHINFTMVAFASEENKIRNIGAEIFRVNSPYILQGFGCLSFKEIRNSPIRRVCLSDGGDKDDWHDFRILIVPAKGNALEEKFYSYWEYAYHIVHIPKSEIGIGVPIPYILLYRVGFVGTNAFSVFLDIYYVGKNGEAVKRAKTITLSDHYSLELMWWYEVRRSAQKVGDHRYPALALHRYQDKPGSGSKWDRWEDPSLLPPEDVCLVLAPEGLREQKGQCQPNG